MSEIYPFPIKLTTRKFQLMSQWKISQYFERFSQQFLQNLNEFKDLTTGIYLLTESPQQSVTTPVRHQWYLCGFFIVNFEKIPQIVLVFPMLTLNKKKPAGLRVVTLKSLKLVCFQEYYQCTKNEVFHYGFLQ